MGYTLRGLFSRGPVSLHQDIRGRSTGIVICLKEYGRKGGPSFYMEYLKASKKLRHSKIFIFLPNATFSPSVMKATCRTAVYDGTPAPTRAGITLFPTVAWPLSCLPYAVTLL